MSKRVVTSERLTIKSSSIEEMQKKYNEEQEAEMKQAYLEMIQCMKQIPGREEWACDWNIYLLNGTYVGGIGFKGIPNKEGKVEIGYGIDEAFRRKGYATEAVGAMLMWAMEQEDVSCVQAQAEEHNEGSKKVLKKNGFIESGNGSEGLLFEVTKRVNAKYMKSELEKCMAGEIYNCHDEIFLGFKNTARQLLSEYHSLSYNQKDEKYRLLKKLFGNIGTNVSVGLPFICDYGRNIHIGSNVSINMNCTFVDCNKITIGDHVLIASNVQIYTAAHPVELAERLTKNWSLESGEYFCHTYALPVTIGSGCWLGGGVIVLPGVSIGEGSVIGAGSVVTRDIPPNCVAVGNPCKVIRQINQDGEK